jgi:hypothetical protein
MFRRVIKISGIDQATFFSLVNKTVVIGFSVVTLGLVISYFSPDRQGYYYTFTSLLVLQSLLEVGMGTVLVQFVSHEWSSLHLDARANLAGEELALNRIGALVAIGLRWYLYAAVAFFVLVGAAGTLLLTRHGIPTGVLTPWWLLCGAVSISILQVPLRSFLEGSNQIARVQKIATANFAFGSVAGWIAIICGLQLNALSISAGTTAIFGLGLFGRAASPFIDLARKGIGTSSFSWRDEFWPQQWRIALSWTCGFFMFQSFVPILFYFQGPVAAGRMGASLQIYSSVNSVASAWIYARGPRMGILGANGKFGELKALVRATLIRSSAVAATCAIFALAGYGVLKYFNYKVDRFTGVGSLLALLLALIVLQRANVETLAIRFQKIEPFVLSSIASAFLVCLSNLVMSKYYGDFGVCSAFAIIMAAITVPWCHRIYLTSISSLSTRNCNFET